MIYPSEHIFFKWYQLLLLEMANSAYGRELLAIPMNLPLSEKVVKIGPNFVQVQISDAEYVTEFRTGKRYANVIRNRWSEFADVAAFYEKRMRDRLEAEHAVYRKRYGIGVAGGVLAWATVSIIFPDADPETDTVDGRVGRVGVDESLSTIRAGAGNDSFDAQPESSFYELRASTTSPDYARMVRSIFLFDTSVVGADTISDAVFAYHVTSKANDLLADGSTNSRGHLVAATPASNTALVDADYGEVGSTSFGESVNQADLAADYNDITLNATGIEAIDKTGISKFALLYGFDLNNTAVGITWTSDGLQSVIAKYADDTSDPTEDPRLTLTHAVPRRIFVIS